MTSFRSRVTLGPQLPIWFVISPRYSDRAHPIRWTVVRSSSESRSSFSISSHLDISRCKRRASDHAQNLKGLRSTAVTLPPENAELSEQIAENSELSEKNAELA